MSNNPEIQEVIEARLAAYVDSELDANDRAEIEKHLQQNPQHRRLLEELRKERDLLRALPREAAPIEFADAFAAQLERSVLLEGPGEYREPRMQIGAWPRIFAAAAIVLLTIGLASIVYFALPGHTPPTVAINTGQLKSLRTSSQPAMPIGSADEFEEHEALKTAKRDNQDNDQVSEKPDTGALAKIATPNKSLGLDSALKGDALEQLAKVVSRTEQVKSLLNVDSPDDASTLQTAGQRSAQKDAMVVVVRSSNVQEVQRELNDYLRKIDVVPQQAPLSVEVALNTWISEQQNKQQGQGGAARESESPPTGIDANRALATGLQRKNSSDMVGAGGSGAGAAGGDKAAASDPRQDQISKLAPGEITASKSKINTPVASDAAPVATPAPAPAPAAVATPTPAPTAAGSAPASVAGAAPGAPVAVAPGVSSAPSPVPTASPVRHNAPEIAAAAAPSPPAAAKELTHESQTAKDRPESGKAVALADGSASVDNLYIARRLSRRQARELAETLGRSGEVGQANVYPEGYGSAFNVAAAKGSAAPAKPVSEAGPGDNRLRDLSPSGSDQPLAKSEGPTEQMKDGIASPKPGMAIKAGLIGATTQAVDAIVQRGDELRLRFPGSAADKNPQVESEVVRVKEDGTIDVRRVTGEAPGVPVAGKTVSEAQKALREIAAVTNGPATDRRPGDEGLVLERVGTPPLAAARGTANATAFGAAGAKPAAPFQPSEPIARAAISRRASADGGLATQPAAIALDAEAALVDVVIVLQKGPPLAVTTAVPTTLPAELLPAAPPAALPAAPAPATQPARTAPTTAPASN